MDEVDQGLIAEAADVQVELWEELMTRLSKKDRQMLQLYLTVNLQELLLGGILRAGPVFDRSCTRENLRENVVMARALLQVE